MSKNSISGCHICSIFLHSFHNAYNHVHIELLGNSIHLFLCPRRKMSWRRIAISYAALLTTYWRNKVYWRDIYCTSLRPFLLVHWLDSWFLLAHFLAPLCFSKLLKDSLRAPKKWRNFSADLKYVLLAHRNALQCSWEYWSLLTEIRINLQYILFI